MFVKDMNCSVCEINTIIEVIQSLHLAFMMKFGLTLILLSTPSFLYCQTDTTKEANSTELVWAIDQMPRYIGGSESMLKYINTNALYTSQAIKDGVEGTVFVSFWIENNGRVSNIIVVRGLRQDLDSVSINLVKNMPNWIPANMRGNPIRVRYTVPIKFKLDGRTSLGEPTPSSYWKKRGKRQFEKICKENYKKSQDECDCWYKFIIWNYNSLRIEMLDLNELFEKQKCNSK